MNTDKQLSTKKNIVVVGNGMVGHHFVEEMAKTSNYQITVLSAESRLAYDRVHCLNTLVVKQLTIQR